jgi:hypothetical protein
MSRHCRAVLIAASIAVAAPHAAHAQKDVASCAPVLDALTKQMNTPYHAYMTLPATVGGGKGQQSEMIATGGQHYILFDGAWKRSPMDQAAMVKQEQENVRNATALSCQRVRDESAGGVPAVLYTMHSENEGTKSDGQVWIAKSTGLILRNEVDMSIGGTGGPDHMSTRYEYTNVQVPAGVK